MRSNCRIVTADQNALARVNFCPTVCIVCHDLFTTSLYLAALGAE